MIHLTLIVFLVDRLIAVRTSRVLVMGNAKVHLGPGISVAETTWMNMSSLWRNTSHLGTHKDHFNLGFTPIDHEVDEDALFEAVVHSLRVKSGKPCTEAFGETQVGCLANCQCGWGRQCYPKFVDVSESILQRLKMNVSTRIRVDVGVCQTSMAMLCVLSVMCFLFLLMCIVSVRTYLRLKEGEDMPVQVGVAQPTKLPFPLPTHTVDDLSKDTKSATEDRGQAEKPVAAVPECKLGDQDVPECKPGESDVLECKYGESDDEQDSGAIDPPSTTQSELADDSIAEVPHK